jgi:hypothetical protein
MKFSGPARRVDLCGNDSAFVFQNVRDNDAPTMGAKHFCCCAANTDTSACD